MKRLFPFAAFVLLCCAFSIAAQQPLVGSIKGVVRDRVKHPVPEVALTAKNLDSGSNRYSVSDTGGVYRFVDLPPGRYSITAQKKGYHNFKVALVRVSPGETVKMADIAMSSSQATRTAR